MHNQKTKKLLFKKYYNVNLYRLIKEQSIRPTFDFVF